MPTVELKPLGELLVGRGLLQPTQLDLALREQREARGRKLLGEIVVEQKWCSPEQVAEVLALAHGVPFARITPKLADPKVIGVLPRQYLERNRVLPLFKVEGTLTVAVAEPTDVFLVEEMSRLTGCRVQVVAATPADIAATLKTYLPADAAFVIDEIIDEQDASLFALARPPARPCPFAGASDAAVLKLVQHSICTAVRERATEIHFDPGEKEFRIRWRIDGRLTEKRRAPVTLQAAVLHRLKWMAELDAASNRPQWGVMKLIIDNRGVTLSTNTAPTRCGEKIVLRVADAERAPLPLEKLGFSYEIFKQFRKLITAPQGLVLVSGPLNGGKRTTLYSCLRELNTADLNVCSIEDPVEANLPGINQVQVNSAEGLEFAAAFTAVLAQSPDVLMVSDLRDRETARSCAQAAMDGRLVLAGASAPDAVSAVAWLLNLGVEPYLLGAALTGVLAQRLVRKLCPSCKESAQPGPQAPGVEPLFHARGCERCRNIGYKGRLGVHELLVPGDAFRQRLSQAASATELRDLARAAGLKPLRADALEKARSGMTTLEEVHRLPA